MDVGEEAGRGHILGNGEAADRVVALDDQHLHPGAGEIGGAGQAVMAGADDARVISGHDYSSLAGAAARAAALLRSAWSLPVWPMT